MTVIVVRFSDGFVATMEGSGAGSVVEITIDGQSVFSTSELLDKSIRNLSLKPRAYHCLARAKIRTVGDLVQKSADDLVKITNFGPNSLKDVVKKLDQIGLCLSQGSD